jgi:chromosome segregation ATPase
MLLSKALKMQQDLEDKKHEVIIENLENKIKEQSVAIEKKDFELQTTEGLLADAEAKITELNSKLLSQSEKFEQEKLKLDAKLEAEVQKSLELKESLTSLQNKMPGVQQSMRSTAEAGVLFCWSQQREVHSFG